LNVDKRFVAGVLLGVVLAAWFASRIEWSALKDAFFRVDARWIVAAAAVLLLEWLFRGLRWSVLVRQLDPDVRLWPLISATIIGAALNTLLPLRGGDLIRPAVLARERNLPYTTVFSTTIVERMLDICGVLCVVAAMLATLPPATGENAELLVAMQRGAAGMAALGLVALLGSLLMATQRARATFERLLGPAPAPVRERLLRMFDQTVAGLAVAGHPGRLVLALLATVCIWGNGLVAILCLFRALGLDVPLAGALFMESALALSVALPQAPGFVGVFHFMIERTLTFWSAEAAQAQAGALLFWAVSFGPVTILGLAEAWRVGLGLTGQRSRLLDSLGARAPSASPTPSPE
jgi:uncharacterized protein (TIRG00374 family)